MAKPLYEVSPITSYVSSVGAAYSGFAYVGEVPRCIQVTTSHPRGWLRGSICFHFHFVPERAEPLYVSRNSVRHGNQHHVRRVPASVRAEADRIRAAYVASNPLSTAH